MTYDRLADLSVDGQVTSSEQGVLIGSLSVMPTASADNLGLIIKYIGTTGTYTQNHEYKCTLSGSVYSWTDVTVFTDIPIVSTWSTTPSNNNVPSEKLTKDSLNTKQNNLTFDAAPTDLSTNPVYSGGVYSAIQTEAGSRGSADTLLQSNIDAEATARANADAALGEEIEAESAARVAADTTLQNNINTKQAAITGAATTIASSNLTTNRALVSDSNGKVAVLNAITSTELGYLDGTTSNIQSQINSEKTTRAGADTTLQGNIDAEATARTNADTTLQGNIDAEATARTNADTTLQGNIDAKATTVTYTGTITTTWNGSVAPYTQTIPITGILAADNPIVDAVLSSTWATAMLQSEAWGKIQKIVTAANSITVYSTEITETAVPIQLKVVR